MIIKSFRLFESKSENNFPDLEEIKSYLYDFTDEIDSRVDHYDYGYIYFDAIRYSDIMKNRKLIKLIRGEVSNDQDNYNPRFVDILKTDFSKLQLGIMQNSFSFKKWFEMWSEKSEKIKEKIELGEIPSYDYIQFLFEQCSLFDKEQLDNLISCLVRIYEQTGFRPIHDYWIESHIDEDTDEVKELFGFEGLLCRVTDEEYKKLFEICNPSNDHPKFKDYFL